MMRLVEAKETRLTIHFSGVVFIPGSLLSLLSSYSMKKIKRMYSNRKRQEGMTVFEGPILTSFMA